MDFPWKNLFNIAANLAADRVLASLWTFYGNICLALLVFVFNKWHVGWMVGALIESDTEEVWFKSWVMFYLTLDKWLSKWKTTQCSNYTTKGAFIKFIL